MCVCVCVCVRERERERECVCVCGICGGFDEDFKMHVKLNKSDFFGKLIITQSENLGIRSLGSLSVPSGCVWNCVSVYVSVSLSLSLSVSLTVCHAGNGAED